MSHCRSSVDERIVPLLGRLRPAAPAHKVKKRRLACELCWATEGVQRRIHEYQVGAHAELTGGIGTRESTQSESSPAVPVCSSALRRHAPSAEMETLPAAPFGCVAVFFFTLVARSESVSGRQSELNVNLAFLDHSVPNSTMSTPHTLSQYLIPPNPESSQRVDEHLQQLHNVY